MLIVKPLTGSFPLAYKYDPAFDTELPDFDDQYKRCLITLDWSTITKPGQRPTMLWFRPIRGGEMRRFISRLDGMRAALFAVRLALERVDEGGPEFAKIERVIDGDYPEFGLVLSEKQTELLEDASYHLGRTRGELINMIGGQVLARSTQLSPPS
jgi:hypothetical protein